MRLRLTKVDEFQFLTCLKHEVWGSKNARFKDWQIGDYLVFTVDKAIAGLAEVSGGPYVSKEQVWDNGLFPHRIPLKFLHALSPQSRLPILGGIRDALLAAWGPTSYGWGILNQSLLPGDSANIIISAINSQTSDLQEILSNIDQYLELAKQQRDASQGTKTQKAIPDKTVAKAEEKHKEVITSDTVVSANGVLSVEEAEKKSDEPNSDSAHSRAQSALIRLGIVTNCAVWVASNDRNRIYKGKALGEGCLKTLPNLGLSKDATNRISLIDVIWVRQNAPLCAFEVETTTSVYSGLLRMSDLLALVPALKVQLFIVAPKERQAKVMDELARPTFRKIGLSDFCQFIATEDLDELLSKVEGLQGYVQPTVIDKIAVRVEDEKVSALE